VMMIESMGTVITRSPSDSVGIDAYSRWSGGRPIIVLTDDKQDAARSNFDAAHELGHLIMHPDAEPGSSMIERQAHAFASAFLMPAHVIAQELPRRFDLASYVDLKRRWRVSIQALLYRAQALEVMSEASFRRAMTRISLWGWRTGEPHSLGAPDEPTLIRSALELLDGAGSSGIDWLLHELSIPQDMLSVLLPSSRARPALMQ